MAQDAEFRVLARKPVGLRAPAEAAMPMPSRVLETRPAAKEGAAKEAESWVDPPDVDFLIHTSKGSQAWFQGREYRLGQDLNPGAFKVRTIAPHTVELQGPHGTTRRSTLDLPGASTAPSPTEAP